MAKKQKIVLGYFPNGNNSTYPQVKLIEDLMDKNGYSTQWWQIIFKYGMRNPQRIMTKTTASKLITALQNKIEVEFWDR